jgi:hypothetical protein
MAFCSLPTCAGAITAVWDNTSSKRSRYTHAKPSNWGIAPFENADAARIEYLTEEEQHTFVSGCSLEPDFQNLVVVALRKIPANVANGVNPRLDDIWGDSSIRNTPQVILWIVRQYFVHGMAPEYERKATVHILKSRNGRTGHVDLDFDPDYLRFRNEFALEQVRIP